MLSLGALSFASPWLLAGLLALPALWWLLRLIPPPPRRFDFPAIRLLFGLASRQQTAASAPLWLLLLRLALVACCIAAAAGPAWRRGAADGQGPWLVVVDNGWAAGKHWQQRRQRLLTMIDRAERDNQTVALLATAPPAEGGAIGLTGPLAAAAARDVATALAPHPWPVDRAAALQALAALPHGRAMQVAWLTDGFADDGAAALAARLQTYGQLRLMLPAEGQAAQLLWPPSGDRGETVLRLARPGGGPAATGRLRALDALGRSLAVLDIAWAAGAEEARLTVNWPNELKSLMARLVIDGEEQAGATILLDGRWSRHALGLVDDGGRDRMPLLDDLFYGERAAGGFAEIRRGSVADLLQRPLSLLVLPDRGGLDAEEHRQLKDWVSAGGTLLRFAGPALAGNPDDLLPVRLRTGERLLGGSLSWAQPMALAPMPAGSPFAGLAVPPDLTVSAQILAEPDLTLAERSWATLVDGTPLVTGAPLGKGWLVLIHTTAWPGWSNLAMTGLFPDMLQRLLDRSQGIAAEQSERSQPALAQLDGFGRLTPPGPLVEAWPAGAAMPPLGPRHPPGLYGDNGRKRAVNLSAAIAPPKRLTVPGGAIAGDLGAGGADRDLAPWLYGLALALLLLDLALVTGLRRSLAALALAGLLAGPAGAVDDVAAILDTRLAYLLTGDRAVDEVSRAGLAALSRQVVRRTTALLAEPDGVEADRDQLSVYPLLYWPLAPAARPLPARAVERLNDFLRHGGLLLIDSRDGGAIAAERLRQLTAGLDIPPLARVDDQHVLARSFYLLHDFPGRLAGAALYGEQGGDAAHDFVSPVLLGGNDWAAAWAVDKEGMPLHPVVPGGEAQREMAFRFGINLVIYAMTGSYKADQIHVPAILERMHR